MSQVEATIVFYREDPGDGHEYEVTFRAGVGSAGDELRIGVPEVVRVVRHLVYPDPTSVELEPGFRLRADEAWRVEAALCEAYEK